MLNDFLVYVLYLFYGLAFFTMGVAIASKDMRASNLQIARHLWVFALFALVHACHEWLELFIILEPLTLPSELIPLFLSLKLIPVSVSFYLLLLFGIRVLGIALPKRKNILVLVPIALTLMIFLWAALRDFHYSLEFFRWADLRIRNFIGLPGSILSGIGLLLYSHTLKPLGEKGARNFAGAGLFLLFYGVLAGVIPSGTAMPVLGLQVEFFRAVTAIVILHFLMNAMHIFDLEQRKIIEERLSRFAQSEKLSSLGKLAAGIAHEINNPLTNVSLNVELLKKDLDSAVNLPSPRKRFEAIERNLDRASRIARELLHFARHKDAESVLADLNEVIESTITLLGPRTQDYRFQLNLGNIPPVLCVPWRLEEVFLNVIINAMEATPTGGDIVISTFENEDNVLAQVSDSGSGIPPENLNLIFDPFFTTKEVGKGTGLGLSVCFGIMERHGGKISVDSVLGKGTTMILQLPKSGVV